VIRVVVVDDESLLRGGLVSLVDSADDLSVVGEASNGAEALAVVAELLPDVVLMDIRMPEMDGLEATRRLATDPRTAVSRVLVLTTFDLDEYVFEALRVGASGFLLKAAMPDELRAAIRVVASGEALLAPSATRRLIEEFTSRPATSTGPRVPIPEITGRERDVLAAVARGQSNSEIADELHMSLSTVKTHVSHLLMKLDARDRTQLVVKAYEARFAIPGAG
jgi:DNA-binding NarL/FixJ family response regulator